MLIDKASKTGSYINKYFLFKAFSVRKQEGAIIITGSG